MLLDLRHNLTNLEWTALDLRKGYSVDQIFRANHCAQLPEIHLGNDDSFEAGKHFTQVLRERIQVSKMGAGNRLAFILQLLIEP